MLSKKETEFIRYWEQNRLKRKKTVRQFLLGIPAGLLIVIPIVVNLVSGWYKRANMEANSQDFNPTVLLVALLLIVGFTAIFWQRHQWEQYEQHYVELLARKVREEAVSATAPDSGSDSGAARGAGDQADPGVAIGSSDSGSGEGSAGSGDPATGREAGSAAGGEA